MPTTNTKKKVVKKQPATKRQHCTSIYFNRSDGGLMKNMFEFMPAAINERMSQAGYFEEILIKDLERRGILVSPERKIVCSKCKHETPESEAKFITQDKEDNKTGRLNEKEIKKLLNGIKNRKQWQHFGLSAAKKWTSARISLFEEWLKDYLKKEKE